MVLRGAEMRQKNNFSNFFDKLYERDKEKKTMEAASAQAKMEAMLKQAQIAKIEKEAQTPDYESLAMSGLMKSAQGGEPNPQELAAMKATDQLRQTKLTINPTTGLPMPAARSIFDVIGGGGGGIAQKQPVVSPQNTFDRMSGLGANDIQTQEIPQIDASALGSEGIQLDGPAPARQSMLDKLEEGSRPQFEPPMPSNPVDAKEAYKSKVGMAEEREKSGIKLEEKAAESKMDQAARAKGIKSLVTNIDQLIKDAEGTPSGMLEGTAATISEKLGVPTESAKKRAAFESGKAISGLQSRIAFLKGQGTITDSEAKQAMAFLPDRDDPIEIKRVKLESAKTYMNGLAGGNDQEESDSVTMELKRRGLL